MGFANSGGTDPDGETIENNISGKLQIKDSGVGFPKLAGSVLAVKNLYAGTDFDSYRNSTGSTSNDHTLQLSSDDIGDADYVVMKLSHEVITSANTSAGQSAVANLKIEAQETGGGGGGWSDVLAEKIISIATITDTKDYAVATIELVIPLTAGMKTNGLDVKITSTITVNYTAGSNVYGNFKNIQTWFELKK